MQIALTQPATAQLRPGERMVAGLPYVFDANLLRLHLAIEAVQASTSRPTSTLSDAEVSSLWGKWLIVDGAKRQDLLALPAQPNWTVINAFGTAICDERARRPALSAPYTGATSAEAAA